MNDRVLIAYFIIQFIVQLVMYKPIFKIINKLYMLLPKYMEFSGFDEDTIKHVNDKYIQVMTVICFILNISISIFVKMFTSAGAASGMTNLFASVLLGFVMYIDINMAKKKLSKTK